MIKIKENSHTYPFRVFRSLAIIAAILLIIHVVLKFISVIIFDQQHGFFFELSNRFDVNDENSVPQWFSQLLFLFIAGSAGLAGYLESGPTKKRLWYIMTVVGLMLSIDDVATLHEFILQTLHIAFLGERSSSFIVNAWWIFLPLVLIPAGVLAWQGWRHLPRRTITLIVLGGSTFVIGKILMDSFANNVSDIFVDRGLVQGAEKTFQYLGSSIVVYANLDYLRGHHKERIAKAIDQLKK